MPKITHLRPKSIQQRGADGAVLQYSGGAPEMVDRFWAKSNLQSRALPEFGGCGA